MFKEIIKHIDKQLIFFNREAQTRGSRYSIQFCLDRLLFLQNLRDTLAFDPDEVENANH